MDNCVCDVGVVGVVVNFLWLEVVLHYHVLASSRRLTVSMTSVVYIDTMHVSDLTSEFTTLELARASEGCVEGWRSGRDGGWIE